jgi:hypothetical protein
LSVRPDIFGRDPIASVVSRDVGGFLIGTVVLAFAWELWARRAFLEEILEKAQISSSIHEAGVVAILRSYKMVDWALYLQDARELDLFFAYARTWRTYYDSQLKNIAARKGAIVRVILPDPNDQTTVSELARRFGYELDDLKGRIVETKDYFQGLQERGARIQVWFWKGSMQFSSYMIDNVGILVLYSHRRQRQDTPAIVCRKGGALYEFLRTEFDSIALERPEANRVVG